MKIPGIRKSDNSIFLVVLGYSILVISILIFDFIGISEKWRNLWDNFSPISFSFIIDVLDSGIIQNLMSSLLIGGWLYLSRISIRRLFLNNAISVRAPLMLSASPVMLARDSHVWNKIDYYLDIELCYSGLSALESLVSGECSGAVVSHVALVNFLGSRATGKYDFSVIAFAKIKNNVQIVTRKSGGEPIIRSYSDLLSNPYKIGRMADTIHDEMIEYISSVQQHECVNIDSPVMGINLLMTSEIDALLLWEPHFGLFDHIENIHLVDMTDCKDMEWYMCLVCSNDFLKQDNNRMRASLRSAIENASDRCRVNRSELINYCYDRVNSEFLGLRKDDFEKNASIIYNNITFGINRNKTGFLDKIDEMLHVNKYLTGAALLEKMVWK